METPIWDAALVAARERIGNLRFFRWRRNRPHFVDFLINDPDLALAVYQESLAKRSSNNDATDESPVSPEN